MTNEEIFKEIENRIKIFYKNQKKFKIIDSKGNELDTVFTTSEKQDIREMIDEGKSIQEIVMSILMWNNSISDIFNSKNN